MHVLTFLLTALAAVASAFPNLPMHTDSRWIIDSNGGNITFAGTNWIGHLDAMIPEGLQYQSIETIVSRISSLGMNIIRLTWAVEMVDDVYEHNPNQTIKNSLINVLGQENGTRVYGDILKNNPQFNDSSTRFDAFDAVARECAKQNIWVHLDNQVSKAGWCCAAGDGDGWFNAPFFPVSNWTRGLAYMANHGKEYWPSFVSMSLRNELRPALASPVQNNYGWPEWYQYMTLGASYVYGANPDLLIYFSGLAWDTDIEPAVTQADLGNGTRFIIDDFDYGRANKLIWELHIYGGGNSTCQLQNGGKDGIGFNAMNLTNTTDINVAPVITSEMGFQQDDQYYKTAYPQCLAQFLTGVQGGFMQWDLCGSLYFKYGQQDVDDGWALLNHDWSNWRSYDAVFNYWQPLVHQLLGLRPNVTVTWQNPGETLTASLLAASSASAASASAMSRLPMTTSNRSTPAATSATPTATPSTTHNAAPIAAAIPVQSALWSLFAFAGLVLFGLVL